jgi:hypothetical protein
MASFMKGKIDQMHVRLTYIIGLHWHGEKLPAPEKEPSIDKNSPAIDSGIDEKSPG